MGRFDLINKSNAIECKTLGLLYRYPQYPTIQLVGWLVCSSYFLASGLIVRLGL